MSLVLGFQKYRMHRDIELCEGDVFISDSHESLDRTGLLEFLKALQKTPKKPNNLFLCGDMFDLLIPNQNLQTIFFEQINLINTLGSEINIYYLEGNHDFCLASIFYNVKIIPREYQPIIAIFNDSKITISHGDIFLQNSLYGMYSKVIRNYFVLKILSFIDILLQNRISNAILQSQKKKTICKPIEMFEQKISSKIAYYRELESLFVIEGHYHQNRKFDFGDIKYINLSSFACLQSFFIVQSNSENFSLLEVKSL